VTVETARTYLERIFHKTTSADSPKVNTLKAVLADIGRTCDRNDEAIAQAFASPCPASVCSISPSSDFTRSDRNLSTRQQIDQRRTFTVGLAAYAKIDEKSLSFRPEKHSSARCRQAS
jgi:hypothetical protein